MSDRPRVLVIGAGLAGCSTALALSRRGFTTCLISADERCASDVPAAVLAPPPLPGNDEVTAFRHGASRLARAWYARLDRAAGDSGRLGEGVLLVRRRARDHRRFARLPFSGEGPVRISAPEAAALSGARPGADCVLHPGGAWFDTAALRRAMIEQAGLPAPIHARVDRVHRVQGYWVARDTRGAELAAAPHCVVAAGIATPGVVPALTGLLVPARGQACAVSGEPPAIAISGHGYAVPDAHGRLWLGATLDRDDGDPAPRAADNARNLKVHQSLWPDRPTPEILESFVGVRGTTRDRLPVAGHLGDGLWVNAGHGTQGLLTTPITAVLLARALARGVAHPLLQRLAPTRRNLRTRTGIRAAVP